MRSGNRDTGQATAAAAQTEGAGIPDGLACPPGAGDVPSCDAGPAGQMRFVVGELRELWRQRRARRHGGGQEGAR